MNPALWAAKTGLDAQQTRLAVTSNNLANVSTSGFKKGRAVFEDLLYQNVRQVGGSTSQDTQAPSGVHLGTGVRVVGTEKLYTQGGLTQTDNALDVAIEGRGFFQIQMPDGTNAYTRDGSFQLSAQGQLVTSSGYTGNPGISIPEGSQSITTGRVGGGSERARRDHAGPGRKLQRQRGRRAGQHDRDAARLRNELEGDLHRRPDARVREQPVMRILVVTLISLLAGCTTLHEDGGREFEATWPDEQAMPPPTAGAIYAQGTEVSLWENVTARNVGDTLTVRLEESTNAEKTASTNTGKSTTATLEDPRRCVRRGP